MNKAKLEGAIHQLDELIIKESAKFDAETAKEANALSADAKKVFANADASQAEVDAMVKRIEALWRKLLHQLIMQLQLTTKLLKHQL